jgi:hypothetical protein
MRHRQTCKQMSHGIQQWYNRSNWPDWRCAVQERVLRLTTLSSTGNALQLFTLLGILLNWLTSAGRIPTIAIIAAACAHAAVPLIELGVIILAVLGLLGAVVHLQLGERLVQWSSAARAMGNMLRLFLIGALFRVQNTCCITNTAGADGYDRTGGMPGVPLT